ncbi:Uncharacterized conserved protein, DUF58 family, contains vWF domain [Mesonia phycicola]|uniref:Uncharacterized conserved protein, DUF58 family, contains vWF domain n=1 Tax=Mesonia phycicola TaxID=579105 RepID=A0A1M6C5I4_9FLAO|nr:DUF58 domain-containing protein [Mesonia phycicola]SHI56276.1 Uncharacterized conserved protein, DUF58 family, contains vWF domain [Mesonia phycicola]
MIKLIKSLYFNERFFYSLFGIAILFLLSYWVKPIYPYVWLLVLIFIITVGIEIIALYKHTGLKAKRVLADKFSNSDENEINIYLTNNYNFSAEIEVIDEIPIQFQKRDFLRKISIAAKEETKFTYLLKPVERGVYNFGSLNCYIKFGLKLTKRRYKFDTNQTVKVYPSFIQMKKYDFLAMDRRVTMNGLKKVRKIGHTMEFEQIREYVLGDDVRTINWKATAKNRDLMVNQYQDEKSQPIYSIIDTSRVMKMPFEGLKLLDYAINSSLAFSNIALKKNDKVGLLTFSNKIQNYVTASSKKTHLQLILESLYQVNTEFLDSDFGTLYSYAKRKITQRSMLMLYTNFEHISSLKRQLPYLKALNKKHLLVVIFFQNTELEELIEKEATNIFEITEQTVATEFKNDKKIMVNELQRNGIQTVLTAPENLTINTINKYLEVKSRGLL